MTTPDLLDERVGFVDVSAGRLIGQMYLECSDGFVVVVLLGGGPVVFLSL